MDVFHRDFVLPRFCWSKFRYQGGKEQTSVKHKYMYIIILVAVHTCSYPFYRVLINIYWCLVFVLAQWGNSDSVMKRTM